MADWTYTPTYPYVVGIKAPPTRKNAYLDGKVNIRELSTVTPRVFVEQHYVDKTTLGNMITFFKSKRMSVAFTKKSYDPSEADGTEVSVRFTSMRFEPSQSALNYWQVTLEFEEAL